MAKKTNDIEISRRIYEIKKLILKGLDTQEILQYCSNETEWNLGQRQIYNYIEEANKEIEKYREQKINYIHGKLLSRYEDLYQSFQKIKDYKGCLAVCKEIRELYGLKSNGNESDGKDDIQTIRDLLKTDSRN